MSTIFFVLCRPPFRILSYLSRWLLFLIEPLFIPLYRPVHHWNILAYCQVFMVFLLLTTSLIASLFYSPRKYGKVRLHWCRTPHGYHIHHYGSTLGIECIRHIHTKFKRVALVEAPLLTFNTTTSHTPVSPPICLDTDSHTLIVDNGCSSSITNCIDDYISPPWRVRANIEGYSGSTSATYVGTVRWKIEDDLGRTHIILLPNTYYSPYGKYRLLCPQHWAQSARDNHPYPNCTWCATYADSIVLYWSQ
jgi:hypothetical protein